MDALKELPLDEILQAVAECVSDLDHSASRVLSQVQPLIARVDHVQDIRDTRKQRADAYAGQHRRAFEEHVKGQVAVTAPELDHEAEGCCEPDH